MFTNRRLVGVASIRIIIEKYLKPMGADPTYLESKKNPAEAGFFVSILSDGVLLRL